MSFKRRAIQLTFQLAQGATFKESGTNELTLPQGLRISANISALGGVSMSHAEVRVYGLTLSHMNALGRYVRLADGRLIQQLNNLIIKAGNYGETLQTVFQGQIQISNIQMGGVPDAVLELSAYAGSFAAVQMIPPTSYSVPFTVEGALSDLAATGGYAFYNYGVSKQFDRGYYWGTVREQMLQIVHDADIEWNGLQFGTLEIWPKGGGREGLISLISPETGLVGYPTNFEIGVAVLTEFNGNLRQGGLCEVRSSLGFANGAKYRITKVDHELESEMPNGRWFTAIHGFPMDSDLFSPQKPQ